MLASTFRWTLGIHSRLIPASTEREEVVGRNDCWHVTRRSLMAYLIVVLVPRHYKAAHMWRVRLFKSDSLIASKTPRLPRFGMRRLSVTSPHMFTVMLSPPLAFSD